MSEQTLSIMQSSSLEKILRRNPNYDAFCAALSCVDSEEAGLKPEHFLSCQYNGITYLIYHEVPDTIGVFLPWEDYSNTNVKEIQSFVDAVKCYFGAKIKK